MTSGRPAISVVVDLDDTPEQTATLRSLHAVDQGTIVCELHPGGVSRRWLATDLLVSLGKREDFFGAGRNETKAWWRVVMWLTAEGVHDLIIPRAGILPASRWIDLAELAAICQLRLWLVVQGRPPHTGQRRVMADWSMHTIPIQQLQRAIRPPRRRASTDINPTVPFPGVPTVDFTIFRATCRALLPKGEFHRVDSLFVEAFKMARARLTGVPRHDLDHAARLCVEAVHASEDFNVALTRIRGVQVALFHHGILSRTRIPVLANNGPRLRLDVAGCDMLRGYSAPEYACVAALCLGHGLEPSDIQPLTLGEISDDGRLTTGASCAPTEPLLLAHRLQRLWDGASDTSPLFCHGHSGASRADLLAPAATRSIVALYRRVGVDTGLFTPRRWTARREPPVVLQAERLGITLRTFLEAEPA